MFGGIVETIGTIQSLTREDDCINFTIAPAMTFDDIAIGDSIAVNGVCLTVTQFSEKTFHVTAVPETLRLTNLGNLSDKSLVNLERSLKVNARLGGHFVQGHVDAVGEIFEIIPDGKNAILVRIRIPQKLTKYIIQKGFIGIDGMSITVIDVGVDWFSVTFIPHTQTTTVVHQYQKGTQVNIEVDMMGKYIEKLFDPTKTF